MKLESLSIASNPYDYKMKFDQPVPYNKWVEYITDHKDHFTWIEDTDEGKERLRNIDEVPENFREGILSLHSKRKAYSEFNVKKGYYEIYAQYNDKFGFITIVFQKKIKRKHAEIFFDMANQLKMLLLNNQTEIVNESVIGNLSD